jgi:hypothetical protein
MTCDPIINYSHLRDLYITILEHMRPADWLRYLEHVQQQLQQNARVGAKPSYILALERDSSVVTIPAEGGRWIVPVFTTKAHAASNCAPGYKVQALLPAEVLLLDMVTTLDDAEVVVMTPGAKFDLARPPTERPDQNSSSGEVYHEGTRVSYCAFRKRSGDRGGCGGCEART